jgi:lipopolysaccharide export system protein LptA
LHLASQSLPWAASYTSLKMVSQISRLRRWFAFGAILMIAMVAGMYFYARWSLGKAVHSIPAKIGLDIQQTAEGFSISKSVEGRTLFKVSASKAVQFKEGGRAELHNVKIVIFGKDASRFDQITGDDFEYDPASGDVTAKGKVLIDLEANPEAMLHSDQSPPEQTKEPIHLETNGLVFNKNSGDASASGKVVFETPQASGSAVGIEYVAKTGTMSLLAAVTLTVSRPQPVHLTADHGVISKLPRQVLLTTVRMSRERQEVNCNQATFFLRADNTVERILAEGDVESVLRGRASSSSKRANSTMAKAQTSETRERSDRAELFLTGAQNQLTTAVLSGNVRVVNEEAQNGAHAAPPAVAEAGRVTLHFAGQQILESVHGEEGVRLSQKANPSATVAMEPSPARSAGTTSQRQDIEMTAPVMDFTVKNGRLLERAETSGPPRIVITQPGSNQKTVVTAAKFTAKFTDRNHLATLHGEPDARIVSSVIASKAGAPAQPDRVSTSEMLDVDFLPEGGISSITQTGAVAYADGAEKAWAQRGQYTAADQMLELSGSPRVVDGGMTTTANTILMNRATGDASAEGNVKSTYSDLKAQPEGAMLASSDPIHVTSRNMTAHRTSANALYTGDARLWQNANVVEAPRLQFDRDHRSLTADGGGGSKSSAEAGQGGASARALPQAVSTVLVQVDKTGKVTPVRVTSARLNYADAERKIFLDGGVTTKAADATVTAERMTVFLLPRRQAKEGANPGMPGQVERMVAEDKVVITQPTRHATGERLVYTAADDKFVLSGGTPSIFDAERGKITGDSLTFYRHDDRVLVEGRESSPTVTRTQVAR